MAKSNSLAQDFHLRSYSLSFLSEVWQDQHNPEHKKRIETLLEMHGIDYLSTTRKGLKRGGGAAIAWKRDEIVVKKLNVHIPCGLEVVWVVAKLKGKPSDIRQIFLCSFYSPPKSGKNFNLINHISDEVQKLLGTDPQAGLIISGDINHLDLKSLVGIESSLKQTVTFPTRKDNILDVIVTNLDQHYDAPQPLFPLLPDDPAHAEPSDHNGVICHPLPVAQKTTERNKVQIKIRRFPDSKLNLCESSSSDDSLFFDAPIY